MTSSSFIPAARIRLKQAYDRPDRSDGRRILVDRLWPRGISKSDAQLHDWLRDAAPSKALRQWFNHAPNRWTEFRRRYAAELRERPEALRHLRGLARRGVITLVYAAHDSRYNNAVALRGFVLGRT